MPATATLTSSSGLSSLAVTAKFFLIDSVQGGESHTSWPRAQVLERYDSSGPEASWAKVLIPLSAEDETAPAVAGVRAGPGDTIKIGARAIIKDYPAGGGAGLAVLVGRVADIVPDLESDTLQVLVKDARWDLEGFPLIGAFWAVDGVVKYRQAERGITNRDGMPNQLFVDGLPYFTYSCHGLQDGMPPAPIGKKSTTLASHWACTSAMDHYRWVAIYGGAMARDLGFAEACTLDEDHIDWQEDFASALAEAQVPEERKQPEWPMFGNNMTAMMSEVLKHAHFALSTEPAVVGGKSVCRIKIAPTRYTGGGTSVVRVYGGDADPDFVDLNIVNKGNLRLSGLNTYTCLIATGQRVAIEARVDTKTGTLVFGYGTNEVRQAKDDLKKWLNISYVDGSGNTVKKYSNAEVLAMLFSKRPRLFSTAFISPTFDFQAGTTEASFPRAPMTRPVLPHLLTTLLVDASSATQRGQIAQKRKVPIEVWIPDTQPSDTDTSTPTASETTSGTSTPAPTEDKSGNPDGTADEEYDYNGGAKISTDDMSNATIGLSRDYVNKQSSGKVPPGWDPVTGRPPEDE